MVNTLLPVDSLLAAAVAWVATIHTSLLLLLLLVVVLLLLLQVR
jgi:hypothetical protein